MRVALSPSAYAPMVGGVEELTRQLAAQLLASGDQVEIWTPTPAGFDAPALDDVAGVTVRRMPMTLPPARVAAAVPFARATAATLAEIRRAMREFAPDVLHVQCFSANGAWASLAGRLWRVPVVISLQGETMMDDHDIYDHSWLLRAALRRALSHAAMVTACSRFTLADAERRFGATAGRVLFNGVDTADTATEPVAVPAAGYVLGLGRLVEKKGFDLLLEAFARLAPGHPDLGLVLAGSGAALPGLEAKVAAAGLSARVSFVGALSPPQVAYVMGRASLLVVPSRLEPFGIVVLEGWRSGTPVVATSRGGPPEFVRDGVDGYLVDPFDVAAMSSVIERVLRDPRAAAAVATTAKQRVEDFSWRRVAGEYRRIYESVIGDRHRD